MLVVSTTVSFAVHGIHQKLSKAYYGISACLIGWLLVTFAYHITPDPKLAEYFDSLIFPFVAFLPVALLSFVLHFYHGECVNLKKIIALICIVPSITTVIAVVPSLNGLLWSNYTMLEMYPTHIANYGWNIWYYVHSAYSYFLMGSAGFLIIWQFRRQPKGYRIPSILMVFSIAVTCVGDLPLFNIATATIDSTLVGVCISITLLYIAIVNNPSVEFLTIARKSLYNNLDAQVFILDQNDFVLDMNKAAYRLLETIGVRLRTSTYTFQDVEDAVSDAGGLVKDGCVEEGVTHVVLSINDETIVLRQVRRKLRDKKGRALGSYVAMVDITILSQMIDELQNKAEIDPLTGIPNRRAFEHKCAELDVRENLPLSFIVGDVNGLKQVNDTLGHKQGDMLLKTVANILTQVCLCGGFPARIGGDEFVMILPHCDAGAAQRIVDVIIDKLRNERRQYLGASIALGHVTKTDPRESVEKLIHEADQLMYSHKKYDRRKPS
ncbi:diguanylate cyclase [Christensenellaceae bacterium OttesenSCG-928-K19]|nr:diguanylate cyclase [Christensenellaceae bacterium OttesenSCG-928-K19]